MAFSEKFRAKDSIGEEGELQTRLRIDVIAYANKCMYKLSSEFSDISFSGALLVRPEAERCDPPPVAQTHRQNACTRTRCTHSAHTRPRAYL